MSKRRKPTDVFSRIAAAAVCAEASRWRRREKKTCRFGS